VRVTVSASTEFISITAFSEGPSRISKPAHAMQRQQAACRLAHVLLQTRGGNSLSKLTLCCHFDVTKKIAFLLFNTFVMLKFEHSDHQFTCLRDTCLAL
jgi:hypothetical protein